MSTNSARLPCKHIELNESRHTYKRVTAHIQMSHGTRMNECNSACILQHTATHCNTLPTALVCLIPISVDVYTCLYTYVWKSANVRVNLPTAHATHCNILQHTVNHALQLTATHCNSLQLTATHCMTMKDTARHSQQRTQYTVTQCKTLQDTARHCKTLQHTPNSARITLQDTARHCKTLQHTHYNSLQLTATHCKTLHHAPNSARLPYMHTCGNIHMCVYIRIYIRVYI